MEYTVRRARQTPQLDGDFDGPGWRDANVVNVDRFRPESSDHRPATRAKMLHDDAGIYLAYHVSDRYVVCRHTRPQEMVCNDSCVEAFLQPRSDRGYFNFELNCGGTMLLYCVADATRTPKGLAAAEPVDAELMRRIRIYHSMPASVPEEIDRPIEWTVQYFVPFALFERYVGEIKPTLARGWRGNFYKCADKSSHPHWASWAPIGEALNFHVPEHFAPIRFES